MSAAHPAARATNAFYEFFDCALDMAPPSLGRFDANCPAYPLVTCEWSNIFPCHEGGWVCDESGAEISWELMRYAFGDCLGHKNIVWLQVKNVQ